MTHLSQEQLLSLTSELEHNQQRLAEQLDENNAYGLASSLRDATGELSTFDNHPADLGSEMFERGKDLALLEQAELELSRTEEALRAIQEGRYGHCLTCGADIPFERLQALPDTLYCAEHSPRQQVSDRRPVEEQFLQPPFGRTSLDDQDATGFDGEDSWQVVEQYGNSDSPAMAEQDVDNYEMGMTDTDEADGYTESFEGFLATDMTGTQRVFVRNHAYRSYISSGEGDTTLTWDEEVEDAEDDGYQ
ncbi:TraR/DksA C4-type zinc finger protein [Paenibacillus daejeonensis]|uniref:TraR/DksA C4-type zinc finger protein n=1 Tax=Paenibacillus daejeonensis TaxID=135193 RepID=UPI00035E664C|nr:TraR/DksA C4-type zinc finger protein [Paenibacillus daejeonensis]